MNLIGTRRTVVLYWQRYLPYSRHNVEAFAPLNAGVYKIAVLLMNGNKKVVYVGQASDLYSRLKDHLSVWDCNLDLLSLIRHYQCNFAFAVVPIQADRDAAERALCLHFLPSCNTQLPTGPNYTVSPMTSA